jgi:hypothetical protein
MRLLTTRPAPSGVVTVDSMIEPHSLHSGQRPSHFGGWCPQASQTKVGLAALPEAARLESGLVELREFVTRPS